MNREFNRAEVVAGFGESVVEYVERRASEHILSTFSQWVLGLGTLSIQYLTNGTFVYNVR